MQHGQKIPNLAAEFKSYKDWPLFCQKKLSKWAKSGLLPISDSFLAKKWLKSYPIWILRPDLESLKHFAYSRQTFVVVFAFRFFWLPIHFRKIEIEFATPKSAWNRFFRSPLNSACLKPWETPRPDFNFQSWCFFSNPTGHGHYDAL